MHAYVLRERSRDVRIVSSRARQRELQIIIKDDLCIWKFGDAVRGVIEGPRKHTQPRTRAVLSRDLYRSVAVCLLFGLAGCLLFGCLCVCVCRVLTRFQHIPLPQRASHERTCKRARFFVAPMRAGPPRLRVLLLLSGRTEASALMMLARVCGYFCAHNEVHRDPCQFQLCASIGTASRGAPPIATIWASVFPHASESLVHRAPARSVCAHAT